TPWRPSVMVLTMTSGVPPYSQSPSARLGKFGAPLASEPWHWAQLFRNKRLPMAFASGLRASSGTDNAENLSNKGLICAACASLSATTCLAEVYPSRPGYEPSAGYSNMMLSAIMQSPRYMTVHQ